MEAMFMGGMKHYASQQQQQQRPYPKAGHPAYLGSITQNKPQFTTEKISKDNHQSAISPQHQELRNQMDKLMEEVMR